jgi:anti-anti-sigma factor
MSGGKMKISEKSRDAVVLKIVGDFTKETVPEFQKMCEKVSEMDIKSILLDFDDISHIDTSAFACMISFSKRHMRDNVSVSIINLKTQEQELLDILKLNPLIKVYKHKSDAMA